MKNIENGTMASTNPPHSLQAAMLLHPSIVDLSLMDALKAARNHYKWGAKEYPWHSCCVITSRVSSIMEGRSQWEMNKDCGTDQSNQICSVTLLQKKTITAVTPVHEQKDRP